MRNGKRGWRLKDVKQRHVSEIEGKAARVAATELGNDGVSTQQHFYPQILSNLNPHRLGFGLKAVAAFMLDAIEQMKYLHKIVGIAR